MKKILLYILILTLMATTAHAWDQNSIDNFFKVGSTGVTNGANTSVEYNNNGTLGEYTISGSGNVAMTTSPLFVTPTIKGSSTGYTTLQSDNASGTNYTLHLPAANDTVGVLGTAQTYTAAKTFNNSDIILLGASTGGTTFTSDNAGASNFTLHVPAANDTLVGKATTDALTNKTLDTAGSGNVFKINGTTITAISGNTATVGTTSGALTSTHCAKFDASGNIVDSGGVCASSTNAHSLSTVASETTTSTASFKMAGMAGAVTPSNTGAVLLIINGSASNGTASDGCRWKVAYGTGTAPINGATATGTISGNQQQYDGATTSAGNSVPYSIGVVVTGLTVSTAYWFDLQIEAVTGGTCTFANNTLTALES